MSDFTETSANPSTTDSDAPERGGAPPARPKVNPQLAKAQRAYVSTQQLAAASRAAAPRTAPLMPAAATEETNVPPPQDPKILEMAVNPLSDVHKQIEQVQRSATDMLNAMVFQPLRRLATLLLAPINLLVEMVNLVIARVIELFNRILGMMYRVARVFGASTVPDEAELAQPVHPDDRRKPAAKEAAPPPPPPKITWSEMLELNIVFTDNQGTPLYTLKQTRGTGRLGNLEEKMIAETASTCIQECAVFTEEFPPPTTGPYAGRAIKGIMEQVATEDVQAFLRFVKAFPGKYVGKTWKISETFATWLLNNSPGP